MIVNLKKFHRVGGICHSGSFGSPKTPEPDASVDADTVNDATAFLETFFKLYPTCLLYTSTLTITPIKLEVKPVQLWWTL